MGITSYSHIGRDGLLIGWELSRHIWGPSAWLVVGDWRLDVMWTCRFGRERLELWGTLFARAVWLGPFKLSKLERHENEIAETFEFISVQRSQERIN